MTPKSVITRVLNERLENKQKALVIFLTAGDPSLKGSVDLVKAAADAGADVIELGVPFSDPLADGPVIQSSFFRAIHKGATLKKTFSAVETIRKTHDTPLVFMLASTLALNHGVKQFMRDTAQCGVNGLIFPDVPVDESGEFIPDAKENNLDTILLAAPTSTPARLRKIARSSSGFVYYINVTGVTGKQKASVKNAGRGIRALKKVCALPVMAGFGVTNATEAREMSSVADGVIVGTAALRVINESKSQKAAIQNLARFVRSLRKGLDG